MKNVMDWVYFVAVILIVLAVVNRVDFLRNTITPK